MEIDEKLTLAAPYSPDDGINEHGLAVAIMTDANAIYPNDNSNITLFDYTLPRLILNKAKTVDEAIQYAGNYNLFYCVAPLHYMVADGKGDSVVIEFVDGKMVTTKRNKSYQVATTATSDFIMKWLADYKIQLNICPTSNVMLNVVDNYKDHPIKSLYRAGEIYVA